MTEPERRDEDDSPPIAPKRTGLPLLGSALSFARDPYAFYDDLATHGDVVRFSMGTQEMAAVLHPAGIETVLVENFDQFRKPDDSGGVEALSEGILLSDGEQWQLQRTHLQPMFYRDPIETYADTMGAYAAAAADEWATSEEAVTRAVSVGTAAWLRVFDDPRSERLDRLLL